VSDVVLIAQTDPFYAECRAFGRIHSRPRKRPIAVGCHGYHFIPAIFESYFNSEFGISDWARPEEEYELPVLRQRRFRAIIKDLVEDPDPDPLLTDTVIKSMLRELKALNSLGVYVMDMRLPNYKGGHLVDFTSAWTTPYYMFQKGFRPNWPAENDKQAPLLSFDEMIEGAGIQTSIKAMPLELGYTNRLRSKRHKT
jgi:hypothetical protein